MTAVCPAQNLNSVESWQSRELPKHCRFGVLYRGLAGENCAGVSTMLLFLVEYPSVETIKASFGEWHRKHGHQSNNTESAKWWVEPLVIEESPCLSFFASMFISFCLDNWQRVWYFAMTRSWSGGCRHVNCSPLTAVCCSVHPHSFDLSPKTKQ